MLGRGLIGLGCVGLLAACTSTKPDLEGWVADCAQVERGPTCVVATTPLTSPVTVFVEGATPPARVTLDGEALPITATSTRGGLELKVRPPGLGRLTVSTPNGRFTVEVTDQEVATAEDIRTSTQARADLRAGEWRSAVAGLDRAATAHAGRGAWSRAVSDQLTAAYALLYAGHQPHEARRRLEGVEPWLAHHRDGWALHPYYQGLQAIRAADPSGAIAPLAEARRRLAGRGQDALASGVDEVLAVVLQELGRRDEARAVLVRLRDATGGTACARARRLNNVAWAQLLAADAKGAPPSAEVRQSLEQAVAEYGRPECRDPARARTAQLHLAMAAVLEGRFEAARGVLKRLSADDDRLDARLWQVEIEARVELGLGEPDAARRRVQDALTRLPEGALPDAEWRLETVLAQAFDAEGDDDAALEAHARADRLLDRSTLSIPFGAGRAPFAEARRRGAAQWAERLIDGGDAAGAACVVRRARARALARAARQVRLRSLSASARAAWEEHIGALRQLRDESERAAQAAWGLAAEELSALEAEQAARRAEAAEHLSTALAMVEADAPAWACTAPDPEDGLLTLVFARGARGLLGFSSFAGQTTAHRYAPAAGAESRLAPFDEVIAAAKRVHLVIEPVPELARAHTWSWRGRPLNTQRPVAFALDASAPVTSTPSRASVAVVVADPERNLAGARAEATAVAESLGEAGWQVERLQGAAADPRSVREALGRATLLHFSGHGRRGAGSPWGDRLGLHRGALSARDVLAADAVPAQVVLTGCRTASEAGVGESERVGLAQAFLLAGAQQVLGATVDVPDAVAMAVGVGVHAEPADGSVDLAESFQRVAERLHARGDGGWTAFRVWVP